MDLRVALVACLVAVAYPARAPADPDPVPWIHAAHIPFGATRLAQTAAYSARHYGEPTWQLAPSAIVLHYTCGPSLRSAWNTFARDRPHHGELPGVCAHYVVERDGAVYELVPPSIRCRHTTGLNHVAIGIEFVQPCLPAGARAVEARLLARTAQMQGGLRLVRYLQHRFAIPNDAIVGHATANRSAMFRDLLGLTNDHGDWRGAAVAAFVRRLGGSG